MAIDRRTKRPLSIVRQTKKRSSMDGVGLRVVGTQEGRLKARANNPSHKSSHDGTNEMVRKGKFESCLVKSC